MLVVSCRVSETEVGAGAALPEPGPLNLRKIFTLFIVTLDIRRYNQNFSDARIHQKVSMKRIIVKSVTLFKQKYIYLGPSLGSRILLSGKSYWVMWVPSLVSNFRHPSEELNKASDRFELFPWMLNSGN